MSAWDHIGWIELALANHITPPEYLGLTRRYKELMWSGAVFSGQGGQGWLCWVGVVGVLSGRDGHSQVTLSDYMYVCTPFSPGLYGLNVLVCSVCPFMVTTGNGGILGCDMVS